MEQVLLSLKADPEEDAIAAPRPPGYSKSSKRLPPATMLGHPARQEPGRRLPLGAGAQELVRVYPRQLLPSIRWSKVVEVLSLRQLLRRVLKGRPPRLAGTAQQAQLSSLLQLSLF